MPIQQTKVTNSYESAAGSLLAALANGAQGDAASFQSQLASSLNAVVPQVQSQSGEQPVSSDEPRRAKVRPANDNSNGVSAGAANQTQPQAGVAVASSGGATPSQDNSLSGQVSQEDGSSPAQSGTTTVTATPTATPSTGGGDGSGINPSPDPSSSGSPSPTPRPNSGQAGTTTATVTTSLSNAGGFNNNDNNSAAGLQVLTLGKGGLGNAGGKSQQQGNSAASAETATPASTAGQGDGGRFTTNMAALVGQAGAAGVKSQTAPATDADTTNEPAAPTDDSPLAPARSAMQQGTGRTPAAKTVEFQQALQGLSLQSLAVRAEVASGQTALAVASDAGTSSGGEAAAGGGAAAVAAVGLSGSQTALATADAEATGQTTTADQPDQAARVEQIVRAMQASLSRGGGRVTLQLDPPELGRLRVQMQISGTDLTARFETENEASQTLLQNSMPQLREALASQGLRLTDASVQTPGGAAQNWGGSAGGWSGTGGFGPGTQTGGQQAGGGGQQHYGQSAETEPATAAPWNTGVEDESRVNVLV